ETGDDTTSLYNAYLPSALGFSCHVQVPASGLVAEVKAATYLQGKRSYQTKSGETREGGRYDRHPLELELVALTAAELTGAGSQVLRKAVTGKDGNATGLQVCIVSRPSILSDDPSRRLITASLVNTLESAGRAENDKCFFQVELKLRAEG